MPNKTFPEIVRELRTRLGLSQERFASKLRVSFPTVNRWEKGKSRPDGAVRHTIVQLLDSLGPEFRDLYDGLANEGSGDSVPSVAAERVLPGRRKKAVQETAVTGNGAIMDNRSMEGMLW